MGKTYNIEGNLTFYEKTLRYLVNHYERFLSDRLLIKCRFRVIFHRPINLHKPQTFYEKIQWLKLHDRKEIYHHMADKYLMREYVVNKIGEGYLVPLIGHWEKASDIDFEALPGQFVLKCTHDSQSAVICSDKNTLDWNKVCNEITRALSIDYSRLGREWAYHGLYPSLIAEEKLVDETERDLKDYKVFCFNGKPRFIQVDYDRFVDHKRRFFDLEWNHIEELKITYPDDCSVDISKPFCLEEMLRLSEQLSSDMKFLRVDWYVTKDKLYIGELTFYPGCGFEPIEPYEYDVLWGEWLKI